MQLFVGLLELQANTADVACFSGNMLKLVGRNRHLDPGERKQCQAKQCWSVHYFC